MTTQLVVVALHLREHVAPGLVPCGPSALLDEFDLEGMGEAFHGCVVQAVATATHGLPRSSYPQELAIITAAYSEPRLRVLQQSRCRPLLLGGHGELSTGEFRTRVLAHGPPTALRVA